MGLTGKARMKVLILKERHGKYSGFHQNMRMGFAAPKDFERTGIRWALPLDALQWRSPID